MTYDPDKHHRRSIRLKGYDYAQPGAYFITIVTQDRECLFGDVVDGKMRLNAMGQIVQQCWQDIPCHFPHAELDAFVVMPNHIHGIVVITDTNVGAWHVGTRHAVPLHHATPIPPPPMPPQDPIPLSNPTPPHDAVLPRNIPTSPNVNTPRTEQFGKPVASTIPTIIRSFKSAVTQRINALCSNPGAPVWQRNYYEHIIRDEQSLSHIRQYIRDNPLRWMFDRVNPNATTYDVENTWHI
ncbi:MAG: transposase [Acidobacteriota bacterium]|nr:transposase [Blastocatellia bacterium]MDW8411848.1 transposase [Acidobacteriota bacterium]